MTAPQVDLRITGGGSVFIFQLITEDAKTWVNEHVGEDHLMLGNGLAVEWRYAASLANGMQADGLLIDGGEVAR